MFEKAILRYNDLEIRISDYANEDIIYLLNHTIIGSEREMRYTIQNVEERINAYKERIRFISLYKKGQFEGTIGTCFRITGQGVLRVSSFYFRYLTLQSFYQTNLLSQGEKRRQAEAGREDSFKHKVLEILNKPELFDIKDFNEGERYIMYAFIESMNERSKNLVHQAGYEHVRSFLTVAFSRFSPLFHPEVSLLTNEERPLMTELLNEYYRNYSLFTTDYAFYNNKYYVLKENGEIIGGVCAIPSVYKIYNIPGIWGWVIMKVLPHLPYFRRLFMPGEFRFLVFDAIYCKKGKEKKLSKLFESVCAAERFNTGLTWLDDRSELYDKLRSEVKMGALNRMLNAKPVLVYIRFGNFQEKEKDPFYECPAYISGFDFS
ncbi:MAG: hypothetical protein KBG40_07770 [Bacteroidales bacterium]|nr:hypothetical protein [Bacteroidales bacterium]